MNRLKELPLISIVVCAFNEEKLISSCLNALVKQVYPTDQYEVIVIDDESTDNTFAIVSEFIKNLTCDSPCVKLVRIQHGGLSVARNAGIQISKGNIVAFIDGDAVPKLNWLEELIKPFLDGADYVGGRINLLNTDSWVATFLQRTRHRQFFGPYLFNDHCIGCNMAFRKEIFDAVGGFQENFVSRGDETSLRDRIRYQFDYQPAPNAIVFHERPDTVMAAIRVAWKSATLSHLVFKASGKRIHWKGQLLVLEQLLMVLFPLLLCLVWFNPSLFLLPLLITSIAVVRRLYLRPLNRAIAKELIKDYGLFKGSLGHIFFCFIHNGLSLSGRPVSFMRHRHESIIEPMTTRLLVLNGVQSLYCYPETKVYHGT